MSYLTAHLILSAISFIYFLWRIRQPEWKESIPHAVNVKTFEVIWVIAFVVIAPMLGVIFLIWDLSGRVVTWVTILWAKRKVKKILKKHGLDKDYKL